MDFDGFLDKSIVFDKMIAFITDKKINIASYDNTRPWGGFLVIDENDARKFISAFFAHLSFNELNITGKLSPKILLIAPNKRLSWQYHHRRAEIWKCIGGKVAVVCSDTDYENETVHLKNNDIIELKKGERHRLIGLDNWGIIAEIWRHTDINNPSDENDIVRLQDDYGR
ncbi:MAG: hypothetical protein ABL929_00490 [Ferruginibacter sp.]|nr:phosphoheptose isomerase [Ferruginibacter sp.]